MNQKKIIIIALVLLVLGVLATQLPRYFANRINPNFNQKKIDEVRVRNEALYQEMMENFKKYSDQVRENDNNPSAWVNLGVIADTFGDDKLAEKAYKKALEYEPTSFLARTNLAALYLRQEKYAEVETIYRDILKDNPADIQTNESLARLYASEKIGNRSAAQQVLKKAIELTNDNYLKELLAKLERGESLE